MGIEDKTKKIREKAEQQLDREGGDEKIDAAADKVDQASGERFSEQIDKGAEAARERYDNP